MSLKITHNEKAFSVEGKINASTASYVKTHFNLMLNTLNDLTIDISHVSEIDSNGVSAFQSIYNNAIAWQKPFSIIGLGSADIYEELRLNQVA
jgi:ABC-type transporter Mla MlaB component